MLEQNFCTNDEITEFKDGANFRISGICKKHEQDIFPNEDLMEDALILYTELASHQKLTELIAFFDDEKLIYTDTVLAKLKDLNKLDPQMYFDVMKVIAFMLKVKDINGEVDFAKRMADYLVNGLIASFRNSGIPVTVEEPDDETTEPVFEEGNKNDEPESDTSSETESKSESVKETESHEDEPVNTETESEPAKKKRPVKK